MTYANPPFLNPATNNFDPGKSDIFRDFRSEFTVHSPGRINLIGEHTDYNNGFVLPTAIDKTIKLSFARNSSSFICNVFSKTNNKYFKFDLRKISRSENQWENYILGVVNEIQKRGKTPEGFNCIIESDLPVGAGISSSAALEGGIAYGLNHLFKLNISRETMAELSRDAEHNYVGTRCGIMDQYASLLSKKEHLILLDCKTLDAQYVPAHFNGHKLLLLNTMVSHSLAESEYNARRRECEEAVEILKQNNPTLESLRDVSMDMLEGSKRKFPDAVLKRAKYVIKENDRVLQAVEAIKNNDLDKFGQLMYASHAGLQNNYEVSCDELDFLVRLTKKYDSVKGARMMGGGFGGCTVNLIEDNAVDAFIAEASKAYFEQFNMQLQAIPVSPEEGTRITTT